MTRAPCDAALDAATGWHAALPALRGFCGWPDDASYVERPAVAQPVIPHPQDDPGPATDWRRPLRDAIVALAPHLE